MSSGADNEQGLNEGMGKDIPPWLQPVPEGEENGTQLTSNKMLIAAVLGAVVIISLFVAVILFLYEGTTSQPPLHVAAPKTVLKEKPLDPGGMKVPDQDKAIFEQDSGIKPLADVTLGEQPETPVSEIPADPVGDVIEAATSDALGEASGAGGKEPDLPVQAQSITTQAAAPATEKELAETSAATTPVLATAGEYRIQLGAFGNEAAAARSWRAVRGKFPDSLRDKTASYEAVQSGDRTLYRLRVGSFSDRATADQVCLALRANEQACIVVNP